jgi:hypothetical protein
MRPVLRVGRLVRGGAREYSLPRGVHVNVQEGDRVSAGEPLMDGPRNPHDILAVLGEKELQSYLVNDPMAHSSTHRPRLAPSSRAFDICACTICSVLPIRLKNSGDSRSGSTWAVTKSGGLSKSTGRPLSVSTNEA